jgi:hypothetical protein
LGGVAEGADDLETNTGVGAGDEDDFGSHCIQLTSVLMRKSIFLFPFLLALIVHIPP